MLARLRQRLGSWLRINLTWLDSEPPDPTDIDDGWVFVPPLPAPITGLHRDEP